jgi:hypothetical protein
MSGCLLCSQPLHPSDVRCCVACLGRVRRRLRDIGRLYALLPAFLGRYRSPGVGTIGGHASEPPMPGGDALAMLANGAPAGLLDPDDPPAVAFELHYWATIWLEDRPYDNPPLPAVPEIVTWLSQRAGWAADHHEAWPEFTDDVARILARVEAVTHSSARPSHGPHCLDCPDVRLTREYGTETWRCPLCLRTYSPAALWLAVRADMEAERERGSMWVTLVEAARAAGRPHRTLRTWVTRGIVSGACRTDDGSVLVWLPDVMDATALAH